MAHSKTLGSLDRFRFAFWTRDTLCWLAIIALPWQARLIYEQLTIHSEPYEYGVLSIYIGSILVLSAVIVLSFLKRPKVFVSPRLWFVVLWLAFHVYTAKNTELATYTALTMIVAYGYYCIARMWSRTLAVRALVVAGLIQACIAWYQFITQRIFANAVLGIGQHLPGLLGESVVYIQGRRFLRAYGLLPHPNMLAAFFLCAIVGILYLFIVHERDFKQKITGTVRGLYGAGILVLFSGLLITFSRAALITIGVWIVFLLLYGLFTMKRAVLVVLGRTLLWCSVVFIIFNFATHNIWLQRFGAGDIGDNPSNIRLEMISLQQRAQGYQQAWRMITFPASLVGVGIGNYIPSLAAQNPSVSSFMLQPVHNTYFVMVTEIGIIGAVIVFGFLSNLFWHQFKRFRTFFDFHYFFGAIVLVGFLALFDHFLWTSYFGHSVWWLMVGLAAKND